MQMDCPLEQQVQIIWMNGLDFNNRKFLEFNLIVYYGW